jgi:hypothetical protein
MVSDDGADNFVPDSLHHRVGGRRWHRKLLQPHPFGLQPRHFGISRFRECLATGEARQ